MDTSALGPVVAAWAALLVAGMGLMRRNDGPALQPVTVSGDDVASKPSVVELGLRTPRTPSADREGDAS